MSDFDPTGGVALTNPLTGAALVAWLNDLAPFVLSSGYGAAVPTHATPGQIWAKNTGGVPDPYIHDGTNDFLMYTVANIIGAVTADGAGNNTGAVIEVDFDVTTSTLVIKLAGGIAICAKRLVSFASSTETWTLPVTFTDTLKMYPFGGGVNTAGGRMVNCVPTSTTTVDVYAFTATDGPSNSTVFAFCIGPWTEEFL